MYAKFKNNEKIIRDLSNKAILTVDPTVLQKHQQFMAQKHKEERMQEEINSLKSDITEIKELLKSLVNGKP